MGPKRNWKKNIITQHTLVQPQGEEEEDPIELVERHEASLGVSIMVENGRTDSWLWAQNQGDPTDTLTSFLNLMSTPLRRDVCIR